MHRDKPGLDDELGLVGLSERVQVLLVNPSNGNAMRAREETPADFYWDLKSSASIFHDAISRIHASSF